MCTVPTYPALTCPHAILCLGDPTAHVDCACTPLPPRRSPSWGTRRSGSSWWLCPCKVCHQQGKPLVQHKAAYASIARVRSLIVVLARQDGASPAQAGVSVYHQHRQVCLSSTGRCVCLPRAIVCIMSLLCHYQAGPHRGRVQFTLQVKPPAPHRRGVLGVCSCKADCA